MAKRVRVKHILFGKPIATKRAHHERLNVPFGLAVFAADALSSVAYASEEILHVLVFGGAAALVFLTPISFWLVGLMVIVGFSYFQTIHAYPKGGGTYIVSTENLGSIAGRVAAAALLTDYVLTVAVSISAGVAAVISMAPQAQPFAVPIAIAAIVVLCLANLRGAKESGALFSLFVYSFVALMLGLIIICLPRVIGQPPVHPQNLPPPPTGLHLAGLALLLRGFAASCTALTGTEAIADGVLAFKEPAPVNAGRTLALMVTLLVTMFVGVSLAAQHFGVIPMDVADKGYKTVIAQIAEIVAGQGLFYNALLIATAAILFLAANTAFADFPRLCSFVARDGFMPRQLMSLGDRLVFQNGIVVLAIIAIVLVTVFRADTHALIPLYAMGVFISFTLSQTGMAVKFYRLFKRARSGEPDTDCAEDEPHKPQAPHKLFAKMLVNGFGAFVTLIVTFILCWTKWQEGAYLIAIALAVMLFAFKMVRRHYDYLADELNINPEDSVPQYRTANLLLVPRLHKGVLEAIGYAKSMAKDCRALHVTLEPSSASRLKADWTRFGIDMPLVILDSPYRSLVEPVLDYIDQMAREEPDLVVTVIVPQAVPKFFWQGLLHNNAAIALKLALGTRKNVVVTNIRYFLR